MPGHETFDKHEVTKMFGQIMINHSPKEKFLFIIFLLLSQRCISSLKKLARAHHYLAKTVAWGWLVIVS